MQRTLKKVKVMKIHPHSLVFVAILTTMTMSPVILQSMAAKTIHIYVRFDPMSYSWDGGVPQYWNAEIWRQKVEERADYSSIKLEGVYTPAATPYLSSYGRLIVPFDGMDVKVALYVKLPSEGGILVPGTYEVSLTVSGNLKPEFGGTPFNGDDLIMVTILPPPP